LYSGGECPQDDCWKRYGMEAPRMLVLADSVGEKRFETAQAEYDQVRALIDSQEFDDALEQAEAYGCDIGFDGNAFVEVTYEDEPVIRPAPSIGGCIRARNESDHIFNRLTWLLAEIRDRYLECPPYESPPPGWNPNTDPLYVRALCFDPCGGQCAIRPP